MFSCDANNLKSGVLWNLESCSVLKHATIHSDTVPYTWKQINTRSNFIYSDWWKMNGGCVESLRLLEIHATRLGFKERPPWLMNPGQMVDAYRIRSWLDDASESIVEGKSAVDMDSFSTTMLSSPPDALSVDSSSKCTSHVGLVPLFGCVHISTRWARYAWPWS